MVDNLKKLENCALLFKVKYANGKKHENMYVQLPNGRLIQVKQAFYDSRELGGLKLICGLNFPSKDEVAKTTEVKEETKTDNAEVEEDKKTSK